MDGPGRQALYLALGLAGLLTGAGLAIFIVRNEYYRLPPVTFTHRATVRTPLIDGFESYQGLEELEALMQSRGLRGDVEKDYRPSRAYTYAPPRLNAPPFRFTGVTIRNYAHRGFSGKLVLILFNDRLMEARFYPASADLVRYVDRVPALEGLPLDKDPRQATVPPHTVISYQTDSTGTFVEWVDQRLDHEVDLWKRRYASSS